MTTSWLTTPLTTSIRPESFNKPEEETLEKNIQPVQGAEDGNLP